MAVPKKRTSKMRSRKGRTHWKASAPAVVLCPKCREPKRPHRACANCGTYKNREVVAPTA